MSKPTTPGAEGPQYSWARRRKFMYIVTGFCMVSVAYVLFKDMQGSVAETTVTMSFLAIISIVGSYVFGAAWQDITEIKGQK